MLSSGAQGQFLWEVVNPAENWRYGNPFAVLTCSGNNCTAAGVSEDRLYETETMMVWRSDDGGNSWVMQDPHFSYAYDLAHNLFNAFTQAQQIDSLNVTIVGKFGAILRTFDAGETWEKQNVNTTADIVSVHFSDPMTGIFTCSDSNRVYTTFDGGKHWNPISQNAIQPVTPSAFTQCHSFGGGKFSVFTDGIGPIWTTKDNWKTAQRSNLIIDSTIDTNWFWWYFPACRFQGMDTIIAFGDFYLSEFNIGLGAIVRTTDGGLTWKKVFESTLDTVNHQWIPSVQDMTLLDRDTVLACAPFDTPQILISADKGETWSKGISILDTADFNVTDCFGLNWTKNGPIAAFGSGGNIGVHPIFKGISIKSSVKPEIIGNNLISLYPNPAMKEVHIRTNSQTGTISIFDMLGREVRMQSFSEESEVSFDLRGLSSGIYNVISKCNERIQTGKLLISGN